MPPANLLIHLTAVSAPSVGVEPAMTSEPPWLLTQPMLTGASFGSALPFVPPTYFT